jgi:sugar/nucleoside kinase (ribokinase family)
MATYLGATRGITPADIDKDLISSAKVTYLEGYLWDEKNAKDAIRQAITVARANQRKIAFTLSDIFCVNRHRDEFWELIEKDIDILFANENEFEALIGQENEAIALNRILSRCEVVCVTKSEKGATLLTASESIDIPALPVNVEDTTGAGDLFAAGFLYGYTNGYSLEVSGRLGCHAAAEVIQNMGARPMIKLATLIEKAAA